MIVQNMSITHLKLLSQSWNCPLCLHVLIHLNKNGIVERKHHHISIITHLILHIAHGPLSLLVEASFIAVFIINLLPSLALGWSSPYFCLFGRHQIYPLFVRLVVCVTHIYVLILLTNWNLIPKNVFL